METIKWKLIGNKKMFDAMDMKKAMWVPVGVLENGFYDRTSNVNQLYRKNNSLSMDEALYEELVKDGTVHTVRYKTPKGIKISKFTDWQSHFENHQYSGHTKKRTLNMWYWKDEEQKEIT